MIDRETGLRAALANALSEVLLCRGQSLYADVVGLLAALDSCYSEEIRTVSPEQLLFKQGAAMQIRLLLDALLESRPEAMIDLPKV